MTRPFSRRSETDDSNDVRRKAVLYARVSSSEQEREGFSIPAQQRLLREYATEHDLNVLQEFIDVETAKEAGRTNFNRMLAFLAEMPSIHILLVEKTDRLYRNFRDYVTIDDLDLEVHLVKEAEVISRDSRSHQKFIHGIKVLMAKNYIDNLSEETRKGMAEKAESGGFPHRAPVGYLNDKETRTIVPDPARAPYVRQLFESYASGKFSLEDLHEQCVRDGFNRPGSTAPAIAKSKVEYVLKNPFYVGQFRWKKLLYQGTHEPIVSRELFDRVQVAFASHGRERDKYRLHEFAFGGLLSCGECGYALTAMRQKGRYVYYKCTNYGKTCQQGYFREELLEPQFLDLVRGIQLHPVVVAWASEVLKQSLEQETAFHDTAVARLNAELEKVQSRLKQAYLDKLDGKITDEFWADCSAQWQAEKARIQEKLNRHGVADNAYMDEGARLIKVAAEARQIYERYGLVERREFLKSILADVKVRDGKVSASYRPAFKVLARMAAETGRPPALGGLGRRSSKVNVWGG